MPKIVDHDEQRARILDACFEVFAEQGYAKASVRALARAAGVSTGSLYHYFPDKRAVLLGMFERLTERDQERVANQLPPDAPVRDRIRALYAFLRDNRAYLEAVLRIALEVRRQDTTPEEQADGAAAVRRYLDATADVLGVEGLGGRMAFHQLLGSLVYGELDPDGVDAEAEETFVLAVWAMMGGETT